MRPRRIVVTGGPGGGKTTVWRELARRHGERVLPLPEIATVMFTHVFPEIVHDDERRAVQRSIYRVQRDTEEVYTRRLAGAQCLLTDRGTPDGGAYWPEGHAAFFQAMGTDHQTELSRYDAVLFLETAAAGGLPIHEGNPARVEDAEAAVAIDRRLAEVWAPHPQLVRVGHQARFEDKIDQGCAILERWLGI